MGYRRGETVIKLKRTLIYTMECVLHCLVLGEKKNGELFFFLMGKKNSMENPSKKKNDVKKFLVYWAFGNIRKI